jgi:hypothetical protein
MIKIEESTANHEIISALIIAVGMIVLMMNEVAGLLIILAGTGSLALVYGFRFFAVTEDSADGGSSRVVGRVKYVILIAGLAMMALLILARQGRMIYLATGIGLLLILSILNMATCRRQYFLQNLLYCQLRIILIIMLLLLFYYSPIR